MKFANPRTFGRSYAHPMCEVDGHLGIASRHGHIQIVVEWGCIEMYSCGSHCQPLNFRSEVTFLLLMK